MSTCDRQAEALIILLESFQPRIALQPYLQQLRNIVCDLETIAAVKAIKPSTSFSLASSSSSSSSAVYYNVNEEEKKHEINETATRGKQYDNYDDGIRVTAGTGTTSTSTPAAYCSPIDEPKLNLSSYSDSISQQSHSKSLPSLNVRQMKTQIGRYNNQTTTVSSSLTGTKGRLVQGCSQVLKRIVISPPLSSSSPSRKYRKNDSESNTTTTASTSFNTSSTSVSVSVSTLSSPSRYWVNNDRKPSSSIIVQEAFNETTILAKILEFDGSLASYYKNYNLIQGYKTPSSLQLQQQQHRRRRSKATSSSNKSKHRRVAGVGTSQLAFVNKTFYSLIIGVEGLTVWKKIKRRDIVIKKVYSKEVINNYPRHSSPLAKLCAVVICNDAIEFEYLLSKHIISIQQGTFINNDSGNDIFGMALTEYVKGDNDDNGTSTGLRGTEGDRNMGIPVGHPFLSFCRCWNAKECDYTTLLAELAYNAVISCALDVVSVLSSRHNTLYSVPFGPTGDQTLLGEIVTYACAQPCCLDEIAEGIRILMSNQRVVDVEEDLHTTQRGSLGNSLHLASAKGDRELVNALLDIGYDPSIRCDDQSSLMYDNNKRNIERQQKSYMNDGDQELVLPEDWARAHGHTRVARLLQKRREQIQPPPPPPPQQHNFISSIGNSMTTSYSEVIRSDESCSDYTSGSDYDSDSPSDSYDTGEGTTDYDTEDSNRSIRRRRLNRR